MKIFERHPHHLYIRRTPLPGQKSFYNSYIKCFHSWSTQLHSVVLISLNQIAQVSFEFSFEGGVLLQGLTVLIKVNPALPGL